MKDLNAAVHMYVIMISQAFKRNSTSLLESLSLKLKFYQNIIADLTQFFKSLHEFIMHYIETENEDILYKSLYNLLLKKLKIL